MRRYVIIGTGAIGGTIGGRLAEHGVPVAWVSRGEHAAVLARDGLTLRTPRATYQVCAPVWTAPEEADLGPGDVLVLATKLHQAGAALAAWADATVRDEHGVVGTAGETLPVVTATNGLAGEDLALRYFARVYAAAVWCPATHVRPGEVVARYDGDSGIFFLGRYPRAQPADALARAIADDWSGAGLRVPLPDDVMAWKRRKLVANMGNAVDALIVPGDGAAALTRACRKEAEAALAASGEPVVSSAKEKALGASAPRTAAVDGAPEEVGSSTFQSLARRTGTIETDYLNGEIVRLGRLHGVPTPVNAALASLARVAAASGAAPRSIPAADVEAVLRRTAAYREQSSREEIRG
ncbi:ketopantoate reductase family protein [Cumulibacter manganitolerans]|uniref:ketopantoate reductase family protein n=1 Tax=Cumulibacter manganitolerans TaxID=1884992 RepID=UPI001296B23C|nr:2-dehydropantoate 2-reductase N-terminal domain-containing protein [Cumulibacter manganitolerans]